jgi:predicted MFS family arabinose efflux permease
MLLSDGAAALGTLGVLALLASGNLAIWHVYAFSVLNSCFAIFQDLASTVTATMLVPERHLGRSSGLIQLSSSVSHIIAPLLGGVLVLVIGIEGVLAVDLLTFAAALVVLVFVRVPARESEQPPSGAARSMRGELGEAWAFLRRNSGLLGLLIFYSLNNVLLGLVDVLMTPLVLQLGNAADLGIVLSVSGWGMLIGSAVMSAWGGPRRRIHGVVGVRVIFGLLFLVAGLWPAIWLLALANGAYYFCIAIATGSSQALWQTKVPPGMQGRVLSLRRMISMSGLPLAYVLAGPLADGLFEPMLRPGGALVSSLGQVIGSGMGRGTGVLFSVIGGLMLVLVTATDLNPRSRRVQEEVPNITRPASA